jgi:hypothetical protein
VFKEEPAYHQKKKKLLKRKFEGLEAKTCLILLLPLKMKIVSLE